MHKTIFTFALTLFTPPTFAHTTVVGDLLPRDLNPAQTCKIRSHNLKEAYTCSGTLIGEKTILTAAHCKAGFSFRVGCKAKDGTVYTSKVSRFEKMKGDLDIALIKLETAIPITPMKMVKSLIETEELLRTEKCQFSGWSEGKTLTTVSTPSEHAFTKTKKMGMMEMIENSMRGEQILDLGQSADIENITFNTTANHPTLAGDSKNAIVHGDSGGSTYCLDQNNESVLIGVNRAGNNFISDSVAIGTDDVQNWITQLLR